jgi:hypothetical protein
MNALPAVLGALLALGLAACAGAAATTPDHEEPTPGQPTAADTPDLRGAAEPLPGNLDDSVFHEDNQTYSINQILPRDGIRPIYEPEFKPADEAELGPDDLVMGIEIDGDARAYPVGVLRSREMVNDVVGGTPVLVTW